MKKEKEGSNSPEPGTSKCLTVIQEPNNISYNLNVDHPTFVPKYKDAVKKIEKSFWAWKHFFEKYPSSRNYDVLQKTTRILNEALEDQKTRSTIYNEQEKIVSGTVCIPLKAMEKRALKMKENKAKNRKRLGDSEKNSVPKMKK